MKFFVFSFTVLSFINLKAIASEQEFIRETINFAYRLTYPYGCDDPNDGCKPVEKVFYSKYGVDALLQKQIYFSQNLLWSPRLIGSEVVAVSHDYGLTLKYYKKLKQSGRITADKKKTCFKDGLESLNYIDLSDYEINFLRYFSTSFVEFMTFDIYEKFLNEKFKTDIKVTAADNVYFVRKECLINKRRVVSERYENERQE